MTKEEAIKILDDYEIVPMDFPYNTREEVRQAFCMAIDALNALPSVDRPMGEWLARDCVFGVVYCSECGYELKQNDTHFCPNCGARMKGAGE